MRQPKSARFEGNYVELLHNHHSIGSYSFFMQSQLREKDMTTESGVIDKPWRIWYENDSLLTKKKKMTLFPLLSNSNYSIERLNVGMITIECKREGRYININNNGLLYLLRKIKSKIQCLFVWWGLQIC